MKKAKFGRLVLFLLLLHPALAANSHGAPSAAMRCGEYRVSGWLEKRKDHWVLRILPDSQSEAVLRLAGPLDARIHRYRGLPVVIRGLVSFDPARASGKIRPIAQPIGGGAPPGISLRAPDPIRDLRTDPWELIRSRICETE